jgi:hypothetical protein
MTCCSLWLITCVHVFHSVVRWFLVDFHPQTIFCSFLLPFVLKGDSCFICFEGGFMFYLFWRGIHVSFMLFVFIYLYCCPIQFLYQMMILSFISNAKAITSGAGTANLPEYFSSLRYLRGFMLLKSLVFCVVFCRSLFVLLSEFRVVMSATTSA